jgi:hypothetical protein
MRWKPASIGGELRDLSHLHPFSFEYVVPAKEGLPEQIYKINVEFSLHCFTRSHQKGEPLLAELQYSDSRETSLFDETRYRLSYRLPELIRTLGKRKCYHTTHGNFVTVEIVDSEETLDYSVYFKVSRSSNSCINLYIETLLSGQ